ncbi:MAG TPA: cob(I)yrinic acid a,c-diamide adenosyltransferase [Gammaproteobacteria bacterium]|nr:cob(I)yrinic acid a,c-diamide adenosyltransferase [Gammaproteobacteria bacterium]
MKEMDDRHAERMRRKKAVVDEKIADADADRGVLVVHTGTGKGKSTAALGMALRALGHGMRVGVVQFVKEPGTSAEEGFLREHPEVDFHVMGEGFTWETQDRNRDRGAAEAAWAVAETFLRDPAYGLVVLDELNIVLKNGDLAPEPVLQALGARPAGQNVVATGRGAPDALIEAADTVTEMRLVKHAFQAGVRAQAGVEY